MTINSLYILNAFEALLVCGVGALALFRPQWGARMLRNGARFWNRLALNPVSSAITMGCLAIVLRVVLLPIFSVPDPIIHDEFGHLLIADTFASGRLTNAPHRFWQHFESIYVLQQPTYTSQYPPATGIVLAAAQVLFGNPWLGLLFGMGVFCGLMTWMLQAWMPARWAQLGGLLAVFQFAAFSYWINSYWGGIVPGAGGLLVLGGLGRLRRCPTARNALLIALGLGILMNSRPAESLIFGCVIAALVSWWVLKSGELRFWPTVQNVVVPMVLFCTATLCAMFYYNYRVTGHALELPYMLHQKLYGSPQAFYWQKPIVVSSFRHKEMQDDYLRQLRLHARRSSPVALAKATAGRVRDFWFFFLGPVLTLPLLFFPWTWRDRGVALIMGICSFFLLDYLTFHAFYPHYASPLCGAILFLVLQSWRHLRVWRWHGRRSGLFLSRSLTAVLAAGLLFLTGAGAVLKAGFRPWLAVQLGRDYIPVHSERAKLEEKFAHMGGKHLVFVHYRQPGHSPDDEIVYNRADIDGSQIVWARQINPGSDRELREYYAGRKAWIVDADVKPPLLTPYPERK